MKGGEEGRGVEANPKYILISRGRRVRFNNGTRCVCACVSTTIEYEKIQLNDIVVVDVVFAC